MRNEARRVLVRTWWNVPSNSLPYRGCLLRAAGSLTLVRRCGAGSIPPPIGHAAGRTERGISHQVYATKKHSPINGPLVLYMS